jgi:hypothetical protein
MESHLGTGQVDHYKTYQRIQRALAAPLLATQQVEHFRLALVTFYDVHNPAKVGEVDALLVGFLVDSIDAAVRAKKPFPDQGSFIDKIRANKSTWKGMASDQATETQQDLLCLGSTALRASFVQEDTHPAGEVGALVDQELVACIQSRETAMFELLAKK